MARRARLITLCLSALPRHRSRPPMGFVRPDAAQSRWSAIPRIEAAGSLSALWPRLDAVTTNDIYYSFLGRAPDTARAEIFAFSSCIRPGRLGAPSINGAVAALRFFFFTVTLDRPGDGRHLNLTFVREPRRIPGGLEPGGDARLFESAPGRSTRPRLSATYGAGLRVLRSRGLSVGSIPIAAVAASSKASGASIALSMLSPQRLLGCCGDWYRISLPAVLLFRLAVIRCCRLTTRGNSIAPVHSLPIWRRSERVYASHIAPQLCHPPARRKTVCFFQFLLGHPALYDRPTAR